MEFGWNYHFFERREREKKKEKKNCKREEKVGEREITFLGRERNFVYVC